MPYYVAAASDWEVPTRWLGAVQLGYEYDTLNALPAAHAKPNDKALFSCSLDCLGHWEFTIDLMAQDLSWI